MGKADYGAESIVVLKGLEAVRRRPGMYIGSTGTDGLHHLVWEVLDNSIDEAMAGHCNSIKIRLRADGSVTVTDNGRGIPVGIHPEEGISALQVVLTKLHAGGKFDEKSYPAAGGLHGVGVSCVNALSSRLEVTVTRDGGKWQQSYSKGAPVSELTRLGDAPGHGTEIRFWPDPEIFPDTTFDPEVIKDHVQAQTYLNAGVKFAVNIRGEKNVYKSDNGLIDYVEMLAGDGKIQQKPIFLKGEKDRIKVEACLIWTKGNEENLLTFCNNIKTPEGGTHMTGYRAGLTNALTRTVMTDEFTKKHKTSPIAEDMREGLVTVLSVKVPQPQFEGQTKTKLGTAAARSVTQQVVYDQLKDWIAEHEAESRTIGERIASASRAREAAQRARDNARKQSDIITSSLPGKLADCQTQNPAEAEIFVVEGESAGGSAKQARDRYNQAILPLRGKVLNCERAKMTQMLANSEINMMMAALGLGIGAGDFDLQRLRYHKVIIMTDADVDGCLTGDTRIKLLDGTYPTMSELAERYPDESTEFWVWANDGAGRHVPAKAHSPRITRHVDKICEVELDNGAVIRATENHPFMLRTGKFARADQLLPGQSLMRMSWHVNPDDAYNGGREEIYVPADRKKYATHRYVASFFHDIDGLEIHHTDENQLNNVPENLEPMPAQDHRSLHGKKSSLVEDYNGSETQRERIRELHKKGIYSYTGFKEYRGSALNSAVASERNRKMWKDPEYKAFMKNQQKEWLASGGSEIISKNVTQQWKDKNVAFRMQATRIVNVIKKTLKEHGLFNRRAYEESRPKTGIPKYSNMMKKMGFHTVIDAAIFAKKYNHKVISVRLVNLPSAIPVYDLTVARYHNFLVSTGDGGGVFVHNSHIRTLLLTFFFRQMPEIILAGHLYIAQPPLFKVVFRKRTHYAFDEAALGELQARFGEGAKPDISRFKGLGEMPPQMLWETTMNPASRKMLQVKVTDVVSTDAAFDLLMGNDPVKRAKFIFENALNVQTLDI